MAMRDILDRQANTIEYVLHTHGIAAQVDGGRLSTRLAHFHVVLPHAVRPQQVAPIIPEIAHELGVNACRLAPDENGIFLEVPRLDPVPVRLLPLVQRVADVVPPATPTLGVDTEGTPLLLRLNSPDVDPVIISGVKGSGKSGLLRTMALSLALHNSPDRLRLLLLDCTGEGLAFSGMESLPHLACPIARGPSESLLNLRWALRVLSRRTHTSADDELFFDEGAASGEEGFDYLTTPAVEPTLVVMVHGADMLCATGNRRVDAEVTDALNNLLSAGGRHDIFMVVTAERPDQIPGVNASWGARITGRVPSPEAARLATGVKGSGAQGLLGGGDFLVSLNAELIRFQAAEVSRDELARAVRLIEASAHNEPEPEAEEFDEPPMSFMPSRGGGSSRAAMPSGRRERPPEEPLQLRRNWVGE